MHLTVSQVVEEHPRNPTSKGAARKGGPPSPHTRFASVCEPSGYFVAPNSPYGQSKFNRTLMGRIRGKRNTNARLGASSGPYGTWKFECAARFLKHSFFIFALILGDACLPERKGKAAGNLYCVSNLYKILQAPMAFI